MLAGYPLLGTRWSLGLTVPASARYRAIKALYVPDNQGHYSRADKETATASYKPQSYFIFIKSILLLKFNGTQKHWQVGTGILTRIMDKLNSSITRTPNS